MSYIPIHRDVEVSSTIPINYSRPMYQLIRWHKPTGSAWRLAQPLRTCGSLKQAVKAAEGLKSNNQGILSIIRVKSYMSYGNPDVIAEYDLSGNQTY